MTREEARIKFKEEEPVLQEKSQEQIWEQVLCQESKIKELFTRGISQLAQEAVSKKKGPIAYLQFSVLRSELMKKKFTILLHGYDVRWYLDDAPICVTLNLQEWIQERIEQWELLYNKAKKYMGKVNSYDIDYWMIARIMEELPLLAHALRIMCKEIEKNKDFIALEKEEIVHIRFGEYRDHSEILHKIDRTLKTGKEFHKQVILLPTNQESLVYTRWYGVTLEKEQVLEANCYYIGFENAVLSEVSFEKSRLTGGEFIQCKLSNCNFNGCILENVDFTGSRLKDCSFLDADLEGALFDEGELPFLHISPQQLQKIRINEGRRRD